jgi:hypothetical protein
MKPRICLPPSLLSDLGGRPKAAEDWTLCRRITRFGKEAASPSERVKLPLKRPATGINFAADFSKHRIGGS